MSTENGLLGAVEASLRALPGLELRSAQRQTVVDQQPVDGELLIEVQGRPVRLLIEAKGSGYPRDLREAAWRLERLRRDSDALPVLPMIAAPAISPGGRELLRREGIGYWDTGGSLYLELPWAVYFIDRPAPPVHKRPIRRVYHGRAAQVLHTLLHEPDRQWHAHDLAASAMVSAYTVHRVFTFLEAQLWVERRGKGPQAVRFLREPGMLLDAWAEAHSLSEYQVWRFHRWARSPTSRRREVTEALDRLGVQYALTLASGAELIAPFATGSERLSLIIPDTVQQSDLGQAAELKEVDEGENVSFLVTRDHSPFLFRRRIDDAWVASDVQLYLDLWAWPMRGKEQATHLRAERLSY